MNRKAIVLTLLLASTSLVAFAAPAQAFGWCIDPVPGHECISHLVCVGRSTHDYGRYETCQIGVNDPCDMTVLCDPCRYVESLCNRPVLP